MSLQISSLLYEAVFQGPGEILMLRRSHYYQFSVQVNFRTCELTPKSPGALSHSPEKSMQRL